MSEPTAILDATVDAELVFQEMDGFGVNINARYWKEESLLPAMEYLLDDLGATLFRVDIWGKSNWIDPAGVLGKEAALHPRRLEQIYRGEIFQRGWQMIRYLNQRGIRPYLAASGDVPVWMLAQDGRTLADVDSFCTMLVSMVAWARSREGLDFSLFGPLNETDIGSPEGPMVLPHHFLTVMHRLDEQLKQAGLEDIHLVVAEQANFNADFVHLLISDPLLARRIGVFGMHMYGEASSEEMRLVLDLIGKSPYAGCRKWLTEYGDLDQTGEREWYVAWASTRRLFNALEAGFQACLAWDAFDNYHDHDEAWTIYGLLRTGLRTFTPKKRFFAAKQVYRYVLPGFRRIGCRLASADLRLLAFSDADRQKLTVVGMNSGKDIFLNLDLRGFPESFLKARAEHFRTSETENCVLVEHLPARRGYWPHDGLVIRVPANCIFTLIKE
jgi:O-glycosyl hydrolase